MEENKTTTAQHDTKKYILASTFIALPLVVMTLIGFALAKTAFHPRMIDRGIGRELSAGRNVGLREFEGMHSGMMNRGGHGGVLGLVMKTEPNALTIKQNDKDVRVSVQSSTSVYKNGETAKFSDIKTGDVVIVKGKPGSDGTVIAQTLVIN